MLASPVAAEAQEPSGEPADDPYSPGPQPLPYLLGVLIALATATVPIVKAVLEAAGSSLGAVAKVTIYLADLGELMAMNEVFSSYFPQDPPARTTFQAAGLVAGARVEIEAIAVG